MRVALLYIAGYIAALPAIVFVACAQDQTGAVRGTVVDSMTRQPVRKATVSLQLLTASSNVAVSGQPSSIQSPSNRPAKPQTVITDASGTFAIDQIQPGRYQVTIHHQSYPLPKGKSFLVNAGETAGPLTVELVPGAAVSGHIFDEDGDPLRGCNVQLLPAKHPEQNVVAMAGVPARGAEQGEYRLFGIAAGKYILRARCQAPVFQPRPLSAGPDPPPSFGYPSQFYPAANTAESAEVLELSPGMERQGVDFRMKPIPVTRVQVTLSGEDWRGRKDLAWRLAPAGQGAADPSGWRPVDTSKGTFEVAPVFPGSYTLLVTTSPLVPNTETGSPIGGVQRVDVADKPVQIAMPLRHSLDINGTVQIEGTNGPIQLSPGQIKIQIVPEDPFSGSQRPLSSVQPDSTFTIKSVLPMPVRLFVIAPSGFMKSAWLGNTELTGGLIDLTSGVEGQLRIVVSTNTASLRGTAPPGAQIVVTPAARPPFLGARGTQADQSGQFRVDGLAPGKYRIVAIDPPGSPAEDSGQEITLPEGEIRTIELKSESPAR